MPYNDISELPEFVKNYSEKIQRQFAYVFNQTYNKVLKETKDKKEAEKRAQMAARSVLGKRFVGSKSMEKNNRGDYFQYLIDKFVNNI